MSPDVRRVEAPRATPRDERAIDDARVDLSVELGPLHLDTPVTSASGCFASGAEIDRFYDVQELGAVVVKSITLEPRDGLPTPRMAETPSGMLNAIGLQNPGVDTWLERDLPWLRERGATVIASIAGRTVDDFREVARRVGDRAVAADPVTGVGGVAAIEVNLSCPNVEERGLVFACSSTDSAAVIGAVRRATDVPVFAKLTSDVTDVVEVARAAVDAGAVGLTLINTVLGMAIDPETGRPELWNTYGGLSGPAIRPIAVRNVHQVHTALPDVPILGCGGVATVTDVVQFLRAGASAVQVGTSTFVDPFVVQFLRAGASAVQVGTSTFVDPFVGPRLTEELRTWLADRGIDDVRSLIGTVQAWG